MVKIVVVMLRSLLLSLLVIHQCVGPPTKQKEPGKVNNDNSSSAESNTRSLDDFGLEYNRYLKEVVEALESDAEFRKKLEAANEIDFRSGKVAAELEYVNHNVRTKLDELKRSELQRLKQLVKQSDMLDRKQRTGRNQEDIAGHLDHANEHTFEVADLHKLITKVRLDLEEADKKRKQDFKEYEMQKQFEQEQKLKTMDEEHKKKYKEEIEQQKKKHQQHEPLHHPGSKAQLEEVWEKEDHMENQKFNARTFFHLHDLDGNGYWDEEEVKALFLKEVQKLYDAGAPEDDMRDREEEMERMREHVFAESDSNRDRLISYSEFLEQTRKQEFERDEGWETIDQKPQFTQKEYEEFEKRRQEDIQRLIDQGLLHPYAPGMMPPPQYGVHPAQFQQHPGQGGYAQPMHPGVVQQHQVPQYQYGNQIQYAQDKTGQMHHPNQIHQQQQYLNQPPNPGQVPSQYHPAPPSNLHSNQIPNQPQMQYQNQVPMQQHPNQVPMQQHPNQVPMQQHPNQVPMQQHPNQVPMQQHPNQVPMQQHPNQMPIQQHPNQMPHQQQYKQGVSNSNEISQMTNKDGQQNEMQHQNQQQQQQVPMNVNQMSHQQNNQEHNIPPVAQQHPSQYQQQQQESNNNLPQQRQYQSKYEPHGIKTDFNEKNNQDNLPK